MAAILPPITGVQFNALRHVITALRVALRHRNGVPNLRPIQLRIALQSDINQFGDHLSLSPAAMIRFHALEATQNDITPHKAQPHGFAEPNRELRPWPFRWPSEDLPSLTSLPVPEPLPAPGQYIDILF
jgi:hypothetical protein